MVVRQKLSCQLSALNWTSQSAPKLPFLFTAVPIPSASPDAITCHWDAVPHPNHHLCPISPCIKSYPGASKSATFDVTCSWTPGLPRGAEIHGVRRKAKCGLKRFKHRRRLCPLEISSWSVAHIINRQHGYKKNNSFRIIVAITLAYCHRCCH